jgi:hypothetical protein
VSITLRPRLIKNPKSRLSEGRQFEGAGVDSVSGFAEQGSPVRVFTTHSEAAAPLGYFRP